jgi:hypothetical protein
MHESELDTSELAPTGAETVGDVLPRSRVWWCQATAAAKMFDVS